jgi:DNA-binding response OmpR family regulator
MPTALIVEDEPEANKLLAMLVQLRGYQTRSALDGAQAFDHLSKQAFDVVFLDLMLPDVDGYEICRSLKSSRRTSQIPVIIVTARVTDENRVASFRAGADHFIPKPYMPDEIFAALENAQTWRLQLFSPRIDGEISLDGRDEAETLQVLARLRNALLARSALAATAIDEISTAFLAICSSAPHAARPGRPVRAPKLTYSLTDSRLSLTVLDVGSSLENEIERETQLIGGLKLTECFDEVVADRASQSLHLVKRFAPLREPQETFDNDRDRE